MTDKLWMPTPSGETNVAPVERHLSKQLSLLVHTVLWTLRTDLWSIHTARYHQFETQSLKTLERPGGCPTSNVAPWHNITHLTWISHFSKSYSSVSRYHRLFSAVNHHQLPSRKTSSIRVSFVTIYCTFTNFCQGKYVHSQQRWEICCFLLSAKTWKCLQCMLMGIMPQTFISCVVLAWILQVVAI